MNKLNIAKHQTANEVWVL